MVCAASFSVKLPSFSPRSAFSSSIDHSVVGDELTRGVPTAAGASLPSLTGFSYIDERNCVSDRRYYQVQRPDAPAVAVTTGRCVAAVTTFGVLHWDWQSSVPTAPRAGIPPPRSERRGGSTETLPPTTREGAYFPSSGGMRARYCHARALLLKKERRGRARARGRPE